MKLVLSTKSIIVLVSGVLAIVLGIWNLNAKLDAQQRDTDAIEKVREIQISSLKDIATDARATAADAKRQYEMMRFDFQALKDQVAALQTKKGSSHE